jgi:hypothetical protein
MRGRDGPPPRGQIQLGDLARALGLLNWRDDGEARAIAACLGFGLEAVAPVRPAKRIYDRQTEAAPEPAPGPAAAKPQGLRLPPAPEVPLPLPRHTLAAKLIPIDSLQPSEAVERGWLGETPGVEEPGRFEADETLAVVRAPLFPDAAGRHILSAALATLREGRDIDIARLLDSVCRLDPLRMLPRLAEATRDRGCDLLLDYGPSMVPYWDDLTALARQVADVVGRESVTVFSFNEGPSNAAQWTPAGEREPWQVGERPVLVATDFGVSLRSADVDIDPSWQQLAADCRQAGVPLMILNPWSPAHWPQRLGAYAELIHWSPTTTAAQVFNVIGSGHRIGR